MTAFSLAPSSFLSSPGSPFWILLLLLPFPLVTDLFLIALILMAMAGRVGFLLSQSYGFQNIPYHLSSVTILFFSYLSIFMLLFSITLLTLSLPFSLTWSPGLSFFLLITVLLPYILVIFNIHVNNPSDADASCLLSLTSSYGFLLWTIFFFLPFFTFPH